MNELYTVFPPLLSHKQEAEQQLGENQARLEALEQEKARAELSHATLQDSVSSLRFVGGEVCEANAIHGW